MVSQNFKPSTCTGQDETAIVGQRIDDEIHIVRTDFRSAQLLMSNLSIANIAIWEAKEEAQADAGVFKIRVPPQAQDVKHAPPKKLGHHTE